MGCLHYNEASNCIEVMLGIQEGYDRDRSHACSTRSERAGYEIFNGGNKKMNPLFHLIAYLKQTVNR